MTDRTTTDRSTERTRSAKWVGEMDHTPPVAGPNRTFKRNNEGQPVPDGGDRADRTADDDGADTGAEETAHAAGGDPVPEVEDSEDEDDDGKRFRQKMKEMDHSSPVAGANRTFERGEERDGR